LAKAAKSAVKASVQVYNLEGKAVKRIRLPSVFRTPLRPDVVRKVVVALQSHRLQPQGRDPLAGKRTTAESRGVGLHLARIPRVKGHGSATAGTGAFAPMTVGGRRAHPPRAEKVISKKINQKERRLAIRSAIAATAIKDVVMARGHAADRVKNFPLVITDDFQELKEAEAVREVFTKLGVWSDVVRVKEGTKIRAGKGKARGRRIKRGKGPLLVVAEDKGIGRAARNYPGVDVVLVDNLNAELLAPGAHLGRLTIWTESALKKLESEVTRSV
jgi:large subunit ribosomal protein L4e